MGTEAPAVAPLRILIVDDEQGILRTLSELLDAYGFDVDVASSGAEAVEKAEALDPDGILMDIVMPEKTGIEAFREIKQRAPESWVVFMTGYAHSDREVEARREGAVEVIPKPIDLKQLRALIQHTAETPPLLLVEEDKAYGRFQGEALAARGFDVRYAQTTDEALEAFRRQPWRVSIVPSTCAGRSGLDLLRRLREINPHASSVFAAERADLDPKTTRALSDLSVPWLVAPARTEELISTILDVCRRRRRQRRG